MLGTRDTGCKLERGPSGEFGGVNTVRGSTHLKVAGKKLVEMGSMSMKGTWDDRGRSRDTGEVWAEKRKGTPLLDRREGRKREAVSKRWSQDLSSRAGLPPPLPQEIHD